MVVTTGGQVGIGTTNPLQKLSVAGSATISATLSLGPTLQVDAGTCNAAAAGKEYYDAANTKYYYCNGTSWFPVGGGTSGQISAFNSTCPSGWTEYTAVRGRTIVGTPSSGTNAGTVGTAFTDLEDRTHSHSYSGSTSGGGSHGFDSGEGANDNSAADAGHQHSFSGTSGTSATSNVIPYIQLTYCSKDTGSDLAEWIPGENISGETIVSVDPNNREKVIVLINYMIPKFWDSLN